MRNASAAFTRMRWDEGSQRRRRSDYIIHDRNSIFARSLDESIRSLGLDVRDRRVVIGRGGVHFTLAPDLSPEEQEAFRRSAAVVREAIEAIGER